MESAEHLRPWMGFMAQEPPTLEQRRDRIAKWGREWSQGGDVLLGVFRGPAVAGSCGLHRRRGPSGLEIGYWIHRRFLRQGLATRAVRLLTDAALSMPPVDHVEIHHDKANVASSGVPRRLGYRFVGEQPDETHAPAEIGVDCAWRIDRGDWT